MLQQLQSVSMCEFCLLFVFPRCSVVALVIFNRESFLPQFHRLSYKWKDLSCDTLAVGVKCQCLYLLCVFAGFSWSSRQKWCPWPTRSTRESWCSWPPWDLPVVSQYKWRRKSLHSASTLLPISLQSNTVGTYSFHLHAYFAFGGICVLFVPLKNRDEW